MTILYTVSAVCGAISTIFATVVLLVRPVREWLLGQRDVREAQKCSLRSDILHTYYKCKSNRQIRQYEMENMILLYRAYKRMGGNSFVDRIYKEVNTWEVLS